MNSLTALISLPSLQEDDSPESIFASGAETLFPDHARNHHGDPGSYIYYQSSRFGRFTLHLGDPQAREERFLFAQHIWNASIQLAELIQGQIGAGISFSVQGHDVLELGAGQSRLPVMIH